jgi:GPH family glycoside/pentoside/hexuronide:cation symporter
MRAAMQPQPPSSVTSVQILCYGVAELGLQIAIAALGSFLMIFYSDVAGLGIATAGLVVGAGRVWDALNDPMMGYLSDHTRARAGRRRFWFPIAAAPTWLLLWLCFTPPASLGPLGLGAWMLATALLVDLGLTIFLSPYYALGAELSDDPAVRTRIVAVRTFFGYLGGTIGGAMFLLAPLLGPGRDGWSRVALVYGLATSACMLVAFLGTRERERMPSSAGPSVADFAAGLRSSLSNEPFRVLVSTFLVMSIGAGINAATTLYVFLYWLRLPPEEAGWSPLVFVVAAVVVLPFWSWIAGRLGKDVVLKALCIYEVFILGAVYFLTPERTLFFSFLAFAAFGFSGFIVVLTSLLADVLDHDEWATGQRRGGAFFGFWTLAIKVTAAVGPPIVGLCLGRLGYVANQATQSPQVIEALKLLWGPIPAVFFAIAAVMCWRFPLTRAEHERVQRELAARRASNAPAA